MILHWDDREIRAHIEDRNGIKYFKAKINKRRIHKSLGVRDLNTAVQIVKQFLLKPIDKFSKGDPPVLKVSQLCTEYIKAKPDTKKRHQQNVTVTFRVFVEFTGDIKISLVTPKHVVDFRTFLLKRMRRRKGGKQPITGYTINNYMRRLHAGFKFAKKMGWIETNPFEDYPKTKELRKMPNSYDPDEYRAYRGKAVEIYGEDFAKILDAYLLLGPRDEEMTRATWDYINWDKETLTLPPEITKTDMERILPLPSRILKHFRELKEKGYPRPFFLDRSTITHRWQFMREGIFYRGESHEGTGINGTLYDLRKTAETELKNIGLNQDYIDILLGHKRRSVPRDHYTNYRRALPVVRAALEKYSELFFPPEPDEVTIYLNTEKD